MALGTKWCSTTFYAILLMLGIRGFIEAVSLVFRCHRTPHFFLGARLFGRKAGLFLAAVSFRINAYDLRYAQEARRLRDGCVLSRPATLILARNLQDPSARMDSYAIVCALLAYIICTESCLYQHAVSLLSWRRDEIPWRKYIRSLLTFGVIWSPMRFSFCDITF